jgi:hypothetical protein
VGRDAYYTGVMRKQTLVATLSAVLVLLNGETSIAAPKRASKKTAVAKVKVTLSVTGPRAKALRRWARRVPKRVLRRCSRVSARTKVSFSVSAMGRISGLRVSGGSKALRACVSKRLRRLKLPRVTAKAAKTRKMAARVTLWVAWLDARTLAKRRKAVRAVRSAGLIALLKGRGGKGLGSIFSGSSSKGKIGGLIGAKGIGGLGLAGRGRGGGGASLALRRKLTERARKQRKKLLAKAARLPAQRGKRAPWFRPVERRSLYGSWSTTAALGHEAALVRLSLQQLQPKLATKRDAPPRWKRIHRYVLADRAGILAVVKLPTTPRWLGLDGKNRLYLAAASGQLYRADTVAAAAAGRFAKLAKVDRVKTWQIAGKVIAAVRAREVLLSTDGGQSFAPLALPKGATTILELVLRPDGLLALLVTDAKKAKRTLYLKRGAESWRRSSFQPNLIHRRANAWLYARNGCGYAVLAADGKTWVRASLPSIAGWSRLVQRRSISSKHHAQGGASQQTPSPKVVAAAVITASSPEPCRASGGGRGGVLGLAGSGRGTSATGCTRGIRQPANCVRGSADGQPYSSLYAIYPLRDTRKTLLTVDHVKGAVATTTLPPACKTPTALRPLAAAMLLICEQSPTEARVFISDRRFAWHDQGTFAAPPSELRQAMLADDGTLLLQACDYNTRRAKAEGNGYLCSTAWVRRPVALARGAKAWREVRQRDMLAYRPLSGGRVLTIDRGDDHGKTIQLYIDTGKRTRRFGPAITPPRNLANVIVDGRMVRLVKLSRRNNVLLLLKKGKLAPWPKR